MVGRRSTVRLAGSASSPRPIATLLRASECLVASDLSHINLPPPLPPCRESPFLELADFIIFLLSEDTRSFWDALLLETLPPPLTPFFSLIPLRAYRSNNGFNEVAGLISFPPVVDV